MIAARRRTLSNVTSGKRKALGEKQPGDVWTELLICECGHKFNRKIWHNKGDVKQYGYQCYSSIRTGSLKTRQNKGLSTEGICEVPMLAGWKLQMMAKHIFREYLKDTVQVLALAESMLEKHIDDVEEPQDNEKIIKQKRDEADKLNKRLHNLIEMRADGEISRDVFKVKKEEIENRLAAIQKELAELEPVQEVVDEATHEEKITLLKYYLEQSVKPTNDEDIPEDVIRAFIVKIVAHKDGFDWYLRFSPDKPPKTLGIEGKRKDSAKVSSLSLPHHRLQLKLQNNQDY